jgi:lipoate synthase
MILQVARDFLREKGLKSFADIIAKLKDDPKFRKDIITAIIKGSRGKLTKEEL